MKKQKHALVVTLVIAAWIYCPPVQIVNNIAAENVRVMYVLPQGENAVEVAQLVKLLNDR